MQIDVNTHWGSFERNFILTLMKGQIAQKEIGDFIFMSINQHVDHGFIYLVDMIIFGNPFLFYLSIFVDLCSRIGGKIGQQILDMLMDLNEDYI